MQYAGSYIACRAGRRSGYLADEVVQVGPFVVGQAQRPRDRGDHLPRWPWSSAHRRLDVFINNAGISRDRPHPPADLPVAALREIYETNVFGVVTVTNAMLPLLRKSPAGYIGNVSSGLGSVAFLTDPESPLWQYANLLGYNSSKAALNAITLIYANALRDSGIKVNALSPGFCATDLNNHTGHLSAAEGGAHIARQVTLPDDGPTGVFLNENGGTHPW